MVKFCNFVVEKRKIILIVFLILAIAGAIMMNFVSINYDMSEYLPKDSASYKSMEVMYKEFGENGALSVMVSNVNLSNALKIKKEISQIKNIEEVLWLDTALLSAKNDIFPNMTDDEFISFVLNLLENPSVSLPPEISPIVDTFFKDNKALFQVTFVGSAYDKTTIAAIDEIKNLEHKINITGPSASPYEMQKSLNKELLIALITIAPLLLLLLFLATSSYFDPIVYICVIGISVLLNMGTNLFLGSVSYLTNSIAALLQVAVSMDYSIFLMHNYKEQRKNGFTPVESAKRALKKSLSPISASSMTTIAGFVALMFMRYTLGLDIGLVLAKGIVLSLITTFLFMPGFLVLTDKLIYKGEHKSIFSIFKFRKPKATLKPKTSNNENIIAKPLFKDKFSSALIKSRFILPVIFIALIIPSFIAQSNNTFLYGELASAGGEGSPILIDRTEVENTFGSQNNVVVLLNKTHMDKELSLSNKLSKLEKVSSVQSYSLITSLSGGIVPDFMEKQFISENYTRIILVIDTDEESDVAFAVVDNIRNTIDEVITDGYYLMGSSVSTQELKLINQADYTLATTLALIFIMIILIINTKSLVLPLLLALVIQSSIWINLAIPFLLGQPLVFLGYLIVSCFQMGCTIDYGILLSSNYTEFRKSFNKVEAAKKAFLASFGSIALSASILMLVGFVMGIVGSTPATSMIGLFLGTGTLVSFILMTFILPMLLVLFDKPISLTTLKLNKKYKK